MKLNIGVVAVVSLAVMMAMTLIREEISFYIRKIKIRRECSRNNINLLTKPQNIILLCVDAAGTLVANWNSFKSLVMRPCIKCFSSYLRQIIHNVFAKKKLRIGNPSAKLKKL